MVQWLRIRPAMQGILVPSLVSQLSPCTTNNWACELQLLSPHHTTTEARTPRADASPQEGPSQREAHEPKLESSPQLLQLEKACAQPWRPSTAKNKQVIYKKRERWRKLHLHSFIHQELSNEALFWELGLAKWCPPPQRAFIIELCCPTKLLAMDT